MRWWNAIKNTILETKINDYLMFYLFFKGIGVHAQRMLKMSRGLYTGGNFKQDIWNEKKMKENWGP